MTRGTWWLSALLVGGSLASCVTNHATLEKRPDSARGGGGSGGSGGMPQHAAGGGEMSSGGRTDEEPRGASVLTIVNGVVDAPSVVLCWARVDPEQGAVPFGEPLSDAPLEYGASWVVRDVPGVDLSVDTLEPIAIAGDLDSIAGLDCATAIARATAEEQSAGGAQTAKSGAPGAPGAAGAVGASEGSASAAGAGGRAGEGGAGVAEGGAGVAEGGAPGAAGSSGDFAGAGGAGPGAVRAPLRVRGLPAVPAGTLNAGQSLVYVANGCLGGATYRGPKQELYCGAGYSERSPTVSAILVSLSRQVSVGHVGMQLVHGSLANGHVTLHSHSRLSADDSVLSIASNVAPGQVAPHPATLQGDVFSYGSARKFVLELWSESSAPYAESWQNALARGGLAELVDGSTYAVVFSGPESDLVGVDGLWNAPALTVIAAAPE